MKKLLIAAIFLLLGFVFWMNITPGHFRYTCLCSVKYMTEKQVIAGRAGICTLTGLCQTRQGLETSLHKSLITISKLDFNK